MWIESRSYWSCFIVYNLRHGQFHFCMYIKRYNNQKIQNWFNLYCFDFELHFGNLTHLTKTVLDPTESCDCKCLEIQNIYLWLWTFRLISVDVSIYWSVQNKSFLKMALGLLSRLHEGSYVVHHFWKTSDQSPITHSKIDQRCSQWNFGINVVLNAFLWSQCQQAVSLTLQQG